VTCILATALSAGCSGGPSGSAPAGDTGNPGSTGTVSAALGSCGTEGNGLLGARWDLTKSRFAFGGTPAPSIVGQDMSWTGPNGRMRMGALGDAAGGLNSGAPALSLPGWSGGTTLIEHTKQYWVAMGVPECQLGEPSGTTTGGGLSTVIFERVADGIPVLESKDIATFDRDDQTTEEMFFWPDLPADVVTQARAFRDRLKDPAQLEAFKHTLPAADRSDGQVVIHHTFLTFHARLNAVTTWDTSAGETTWSFTPDGKTVDTSAL
jgi:hypothetical protein